LNVAIAVTIELLLTPFVVVLTRSFRIFIEAFFCSGSFIQLGKRIELALLLETKLKVMLAQSLSVARVFCHLGRHVYCLKRRTICLLVSEFIVTAEPNMLLARHQNVGLTSIVKITCTRHSTWRLHQHLATRLKVLATLVTLFLSVRQVNRGI